MEADKIREIKSVSLVEIIFRSSWLYTQFFTSAKIPFVCDGKEEKASYFAELIKMHLARN